MFASIIQAIKQFDTIILHRHTHPDGDALGSQIGLKHLILDHYPDKKVYMVGDEAGRYSFMQDSVMDDVPDEVYENALAIILDVSAPFLISDHRYTMAKETARLDHHLFVEQIAKVEVTDSSFESCCGLIAAMAEEAGWQFSVASATALFTGMVTDSGRFRYDAVSARTFHLASLLMQQKIDTNEIYRHLYASDFDQVLLKARFTLNIDFTAHKVAYVYTTLEQMQAYGVDTFTISRGMVNTMADIRGVDIWVNFTETEKGVLCELRSSRFNINPVAVKYGGGGHAKASGATLPDRETAMQMLQDLDQMMMEDNN